MGILLNKRSLVYGVGVNDSDVPIKENGVEMKEYRVWKDMLKRCFSEKYKSKEKSYINVSCDDSWLIFSNFLNDTKPMKSAFLEGFHLDKDVLFNENKIYSKDTVCFIPKEINLSLTTSRNRFRNCSLGVRKSGNKYEVRFKGKSIGFFIDELSAWLNYKEVREIDLKRLANKYRDQLDLRAYNSLLNYNLVNYRIID